MLELQTKVKRQIEILGIAADNPHCWDAMDLSELYGCEELTIKRDLAELRRYGFDTHCHRKEGIRLDRPLEAKALKELLVQYIGLANSDYAVDRATTVMVKKLKEKALSSVVTLQRCIDNSLIAIVDYQKEAEECEIGREILPLLIFQSDGFWRILGINDGKYKQYHMNKLLRVEATGRRFKRPPQTEIDELFRYSFKSWLGNERHTVKIRLSPLWADRIRPQLIMETQRLEELRDGSVIFEAVVNSLVEVASWVVTKGKGVEVLEPMKLKEMVVTLAQEVLGNYRKNPKK
jgi:predicted DNA-binding transcriptional regulator YafY